MEPPTTLMMLHILCKFSSKEELLAKLRYWGLIPPEGSLRCRRCGGSLRIARDTKAPEGWRWHCGREVSFRKQKKARCKVVLSCRRGTFFERAHLDVFQILGFVHLWVKNVAINVIGSELRMSPTTCVDWAAICREVLCIAYLLCSEHLGGPNAVVEIDEAMFEPPRFNCRYIEGQWMFAAYERGTGKVVIVAVKERDAYLLVPIIHQWILPGTTIISDIWRTYDCLTNEEYQNLVINHCMTFKDPDTSAYKDSIESDWCTAKSTKDSCGRIIAHLRGNLARYIFFKRCRDQKLDRSREFFRLAGMLYDPRQLDEEVENTEPASVKCANHSDEDSDIDFEKGTYCKHVYHLRLSSSTDCPSGILQCSTRCVLTKDALLIGRRCC